MTKYHTLEILNILKKAAKDKADPKPILASAGYDQMTEWIAYTLIAAIESNYSQVKALSQLAEDKIMVLSENQIQILQNAEVCGQLFEGYEVVIKEIEKEIEESKNTKGCKEHWEWESYYDGPTCAGMSDEIREFLQALKHKVNVDQCVSEMISAIKSCSTGKKLCEVFPLVIAAAKEDTSNIADMVKSSKAVEELAKKTAEAREAGTKFAESAKVKVQAINEELAKKNINWKIAAVGLAGLVLGTIIAKSKKP